MADTDFCYYLIFRRTNDSGSIDWDTPTGGLVVETGRVIHGWPIADIEMVKEICCQRYHTGPDEHLILAEVLESEDKERAMALHEKWELEMRSFLELMNSP